MATSRESNVSIEIDPIDNYLSESTLTAIEQFDQEFNENENNQCCLCFNRWWNIEFNHQRFIVHIVEKTIFHLAIIILVLVDCILVIGELMLDFISLSEKCNNKTKYSIHEEKKQDKLELSIELLHFASIVLLSIFVLEVLIKIYAFGKKWWNFRKKKMEWLDAIIVIVSFIIDIYFLKKPNVIAEISLLFISFRLWRIIRIINSVVQSIRSQDETVKKNLTNTYRQIIELLLNVSVKKTNVNLELRDELTRENLDEIIEKFTSIDKLCRSVLTHCPKVSSSRSTVTDITQNLQDTLQQIRLTSSKLSLTNESKSE